MARLSPIVDSTRNGELKSDGAVWQGPVLGAAAAMAVAALTSAFWHGPNQGVYLLGALAVLAAARVRGFSAAITATVLLGVEGVVLETVAQAPAGGLAMRTGLFVILGVGISCAARRW